MFMVITDAFVFDCDDTFAKRPGPRLGTTEEPHSLANCSKRKYLGRRQKGKKLSKSIQIKNSQFLKTRALDLCGKGKVERL